MITICPVDNVWIRLDCDDAIAHELSDYFCFDVPGAHFMPASKRGWDHKIRLFKLRTHYLYRGLLPRVIEFAGQREYKVVCNIPGPEPMWRTLDSWLAEASLKYPLRGYQYAALQTMFDNRRCIIQSPTGSGKSYIIYLMTQLLNQLFGGQNGIRTLIVVPTLGLITQMESDFKEYGYSGPIQTITGGKTKDITTNVTISTWQSIYDQPKEWFKTFECVIVDEVHLAKAKSLVGIMEKCETIPYRFGFTGTLSGMQCHQLILEGLFGTIKKVATTHELVKAGQLTPPRVIVCILDYPEATRQALRHMDYKEEIDFLVGYSSRNKFLALLAREEKHNTLLLFQLVVKHGTALLERLLRTVNNKPVYYIDGSTPVDQREKIRVDMGRWHEQACILAATYGTMQLGVNIPNLQTLILAHPSKSVIRVLQSIGRILRLHEGKDRATIIDVVDDLRIGKHKNFAWQHAEERMAFYAAEKFPVITRKVDLDMFSPKLPGLSDVAPQQTNSDTVGQSA